MDACGGTARAKTLYVSTPSSPRAIHARGGHRRAGWAGYVSSAGRPQVMQKRQPISSSVLHAGQRWTVRFSPQYGQKVTARS